MYRSPARVTATPYGLFNVAALTDPPKLATALVKLPFCPKTLSATASVVRGLLYSRTRLFPKSLMYTLSCASSAIETGTDRQDAPFVARVPLFEPPEVNTPPWPNTKSAVESDVFGE